MQPICSTRVQKLIERLPAALCSPVAVLKHTAAMELQLERQTRLVERMERRLLKLEDLLKSQLQDPEDSCKALLMELQLDVDEDGRQMQSICRDGCFLWCRARKAEGHGYQVQKLSWRLLCREAVVRQHAGLLEDIMQWVQVVVRDQQLEVEVRRQNLEEFKREHEDNMKTCRLLQRTDVQFWDPAGDAEVQEATAAPCMLVEIMQARVKDWLEQLAMLEVKWQHECEEFVGLSFGHITGDLTEFKQWMERQAY